MLETHEAKCSDHLDTPKYSQDKKGIHEKKIRVLKAIYPYAFVFLYEKHEWPSDKILSLCMFVYLATWLIFDHLF